MPVSFRLWWCGSSFPANRPSPGKSVPLAKTAPETEVPTELHRVWYVQLYDRSGVTLLGGPAVWVLSLVPSPSFPSAFGSLRPSTPADLSPPSAMPPVLFGTWSPSSQVVSLTQYTIPGGDPSEASRTYRASLSRDVTSSSFVLRGTWGEAGQERGVLVAVAEGASESSEATSSHVSGLWLGESRPREDLREVVETNPIKWAVSVVLPTGPQDPGQVFGAGFFDDTADVPGKPVLVFSLKGTVERDGLAVRLDKVYEACAGGLAAIVRYTGKLGLKEDGKTWQLTGTWVNEAAGTSGCFECSRACPEASSRPGGASAVCSCDLCGRSVLPGETRWCCAICNPPWFSCASCKGASPQVHQHELVPELTYKVAFAQGTTCARLARDAFRKFADRPLLGVRQPEVASFDWLSYAQVAERVFAFSRGLQKELQSCRCTQRVEGRPRFLMIADISVDYVVAMLGALDAGLVIVPVHSESDVSTLCHVLKTARPTACFVNSPGAIGKLLEAEVESGLRCAVLCADVASVSSSSGPDTEPEERDLGELSAILFTSGTTGLPKGAAFTMELLMPSEGVVHVQPYVRLDFQAFDPTYLLTLLSTLHCGGQRALSTVDSVLVDTALVRPTHLGAPPAFWHSLYRDFVRRTSQFTRQGATLSEAEDRAAKEVKQSLGNRLSVATSGGAPISGEVCQFVKTRLGVDLVNLYGTRETGGIARDGVVHDRVEIAMLPMAELGMEGDPEGGEKAREVGRCYRGEVCVHSPRMIQGYWNPDGETARPESSWIRLGDRLYYRTGDVGELVLNASGKRILKIVDRKSGCQLKLVQGEWLVPSKVESVLEECPLIEQALVMGSSSQRFPVAVVVARDQSVTEPVLLAQVRLWCGQRRLRPFEIPQALHIEHVRWTPENGLLTSTYKKRRDVLCALFKGATQRLYEKLLSGPAILAGESQNRKAISEETLGLLRDALGISDLGDVDPESTLAQIGGDSLVAARLSRMLKERNVALPAPLLFEVTLAHISELVSQKGESLLPSLCDSRPGEVDWEAECSLERSVLGLRARVRGPDEPRGVLLTGATGFLGPFLLRELLGVFPSVTCLVRAVRAGTTALSPTQRVVEGMKTAGVWKEEFEGRIEILSGDVSRPRFGLSEAEFRDLGRKVFTIYHSAAWVSLTLPYQALRPSNVGGTLTVLELALSCGASVRYVSSVAAICAGERKCEGWPEAAADRIAESHSGYGQTKAVSERLLLKASRECGLDVAIFRPSDISGSWKDGFSNVQDAVTLALASFCQLNCVPAEAMSRDLGWVPVDFVAQAVVTLSSSVGQQRVFHLAGRGPKLSSVVDELRKASDSQIPTVSSEVWQEKLKELRDEKFQALEPFLHGMSQPRSPVHSEISLISSERTSDVLCSIGVAWPDVSNSAYLSRKGRSLVRQIWTRRPFGN